MLMPKVETLAMNISDKITELEKEVAWCDRNEVDASKYSEEIKELESELKALGYWVSYCLYYK